MKRVKQGFKLVMWTSVICGLMTTLLLFVGKTALVSSFLHNDTPAFAIACDGIPYFAIGMVFFAINIVVIGYYQSIEQPRKAVIFTILRGFVFLCATFIILPQYFATPGIWLAVPMAEILTCLSIGVASLIKR